jgi:hypothetical protein
MRDRRGMQNGREDAVRDARMLRLAGRVADLERTVRRLVWALRGVGMACDQRSLPSVDARTGGFVRRPRYGDGRSRPQEWEARTAAREEAPRA